MAFFHARLQHALYTANMTQVELAKRTGLARSTISQYVNGLFLPRSDALCKIAQALDVNERWLIGYDCAITDENTELQKKETIRAVSNTFGIQAAELLSGYAEMNKDGKEKLENYLKDLLGNPKNSD